MLYLILIIFLSIQIPIFIIGVIFLLQNKFDNKFVSMLMRPDMYKLIMSNTHTTNFYKKIKVLLSMQTSIVIVLAILFAMVFKLPGSIDIRYIIVILLFSIPFVTSKIIIKYIEKEKDLL